jgi:hypothetical protein
MDNIERRMTTGRPFITATEDENNVYLDGWIIPKGETDKDGEERRRIVWEIFEVWKSENPTQKRTNKSIVKGVETEIYVDEELISETAAHAYVNYRNVIAFYHLDSILRVAKFVKNSPPQSKTQKKSLKVVI